MQRSLLRPLDARLASFRRSAARASGVLTALALLVGAVDGQLVGWLTHRSLLRAYRAQLERASANGRS